MSPVHLELHKYYSPVAQNNGHMLSQNSLLFTSYYACLETAAFISLTTY